MFLSSILHFGRRPTELPDAAVVEQALKGKRSAQIELARRITPVIRSYVLYFTRGQSTRTHDPEDLIQEVWSRLFEHDARRLRGYDGAKGASLATYVNRIAGQCVLDVMDAQKTQKRSPKGGLTNMDGIAEAAMQQPSPEANVEGKQSLDALWGHLEQVLPTMGRLVLKGLYIDHRSPAELAEELGIKRVTVDGWRFKIKRAAIHWRESAEMLS